MAGEKGIDHYVFKLIRSLPDLSGKTVLDIPCGEGKASREFLKRGADVIALDIFPDFFRPNSISASYADLSKEIPLEDESVDYILCQEGIEHISDQVNVLREFNRVLKKGGSLFITTPNFSHLRSRFSNFVFESDLWKRIPPTELDGVWFSKGSSEIYFGHLFLLGVQKLETLSAITGFKVVSRYKTDISVTSILLLPVVFPVLSIFSIYSYMYSSKKIAHVDRHRRKEVLLGRVKLNLSVKTLCCKHIFWRLEKENNLKEMNENLSRMQRGR